MKARLRFSSKGWFRHWATWYTGTKIWGTDIVVPDEYGRFQREIWVGPFNSFTEAMRAFK
jgi:hypothetical protein